LTAPDGRVVNDVHSQLNETRVARIAAVDSLDSLVASIAEARAAGLPVAVAGGRHAMGGQQFRADGVLLDTTRMNRVLDFDRERGVLHVEAGIQWPAILSFLAEAQAGEPRPWAFAQKQTGADRFSLGGTIAANGHGRGLTMAPIVSDVASITLVDAGGEVRRSSRDENPELFGLAIGGYGLFGAVYAVELQLVPRRKLERVVEVIGRDDLPRAFAERIRSGFLYGDFQFAIDAESPDFLRRGVFSCYRPVDDATPIPADQRALTTEDWRTLLYLTHADKAQAFERYAAHYLATSGQVYWSDAHQFAEYVDDYHRDLDARLAAPVAGTEMITELYVPRERLIDFLEEAGDVLRRRRANVIYGTVRLIERDVDTFLAWARERWACTIFNIHVTHTPEAKEEAAEAFRELIDVAAARGGSYFLTYHGWARADQVDACYPRFREFLARKRAHDPDGVFASDWYVHHEALLADG
jgi:FAD/FMN-containing dehydrogenase